MTEPAMYVSIKYGWKVWIPNNMRYEAQNDNQTIIIQKDESFPLYRLRSFHFPNCSELELRIFLKENVTKEAVETVTPFLHNFSLKDVQSFSRNIQESNRILYCRSTVFYHKDSVLIFDTIGNSPNAAAYWWLQFIHHINRDFFADYHLESQ